MEERKYVLTTVDNPYDPITNWESWYAYDEAQGYHTCSYLARLSNTSELLSEEQKEKIVQQAIKEIINLNILGIYKKVCIK